MVSPVRLEDIPDVLRQIHTPLVIHEWRRQLLTHPDSMFQQYILEGLTNGFRIGFNYQALSPRSVQANNMQSASRNAAVIEERLQTEISLGRVVGPLPLEKYTFVHVSRFGVIPKNHQLGKWRMIVDLSHPKG